MKRHLSVVAICAAALVLVVGCNRTEAPASTPAPAATKPTQEAPTTASTPPPAAQEPPSTASTPPPPPPMPPPDVPKGADTSGPKPGQVNNYNSPAFKKGGKEETTK